ncbi:venom allergen-like (VAL) 5 protein [Schistosoma mansoni]|nr:venom allergen-like (VAL) 5 protein [Schistosoma mansoni]|eukprot:XP_018653236.1 venom allergen-like (VAL) 5 protein [Schistosoma mansoni]
MRDYFIAMHNVVRQAVKYGLIPGQPEARHMNLLKWNTELAKKAQNFSDQCQLGHDKDEERKIPGFEYVGQNWALTPRLLIGFKMWFDESQNYNYNTNTCINNQCTHYTQLIWENTTDFGCGVTECKNMLPNLNVICNYGPG